MNLTIFTWSLVRLLLQICTKLKRYFHQQQHNCKMTVYFHCNNRTPRHSVGEFYSESNICHSLWKHLLFISDKQKLTPRHRWHVNCVHKKKMFPLQLCEMNLFRTSCAHVKTFCDVCQNVGNWCDSSGRIFLFAVSICVISRLIETQRMLPPRTAKWLHGARRRRLTFIMMNNST